LNVGISYADFDWAFLKSELYRYIGTYSSDLSEGIIPPLLLEILYGFLIWIGITKNLTPTRARFSIHLTN